MACAVKPEGTAAATGASHGPPAPPPSHPYAASGPGRTGTASTEGTLVPLHVMRLNYICSAGRMQCTGLLPQPTHTLPQVLVGLALLLQKVQYTCFLACHAPGLCL